MVNNHGPLIFDVMEFVYYLARLYKILTFLFYPNRHVLNF